jgi:hypothetical protein
VTQSTMTNKELDEYIRLGMTAAIANKATSLQNAIEHLRVAFAKGSGSYHPLRFKSTIESVIHSANEFMLAMETKEAFSEAKRKMGTERQMDKSAESPQPEAGVDVLVRSTRPREAPQPERGQDGMAVSGGEPEPDRS